MPAGVETAHCSLPFPTADSYTSILAPSRDTVVFSFPGIPDQKRAVVLGNLRSQFDCGSPELVEELSYASVDGLRRSILSVRVGTIHLVQVLERTIRQRRRRYALLKSDSIP